MRKLLVFAALAWPAAAQLPDFYKSVDHVIWAVKDLDSVAAAWEKIDGRALQRVELVPHSAATFRGKAIEAKWRLAWGRLPNVEVLWVQPQARDALAESLAQRGDGVFSLQHRVPTIDALNREVERLRGLGVEVLQRGTIDESEGKITYVFFDTQREGKYVLGLVHGTAPAPGAGLPVTQYAFIARDTKAVSAYWQKLGWPAMSFTHGALTGLEYRGQPGQFDQELGWQRHGKVVYEWIRPLKGPTVYEDALKIHGEGFHHFGVDVPDMDAAIAAWQRRGYAVSQSGGWGEKGKPGSGRFTYIDTDAIGGVTIELLWNYPASRDR